MIVIGCNKITKIYGITPIIKDISFQVNLGDKIGLVGRNGTGKTTLLKILAKELSYDSGDLYIKREITLGYLKQDSGLESSLSLWNEMEEVFDEIIKMEKNLEILQESIAEHAAKNLPYEAIMEDYNTLLEQFDLKDGYRYRSKIRGVLKGLGFKEDEFSKGINTLSGGQKTRVSLAKELLRNPDVLLLDEPTNYLDMSSVQWLEGFLKDFRGTVILVSHDRYFLDQVINTVYEIEDLVLSIYKVNYTRYLKEKEVRYEQALKEYNLQQKEIKKIEGFIRQQRAWGREKNFIRAASRQKMLDKIERIDKPKVNSKKMGIDLEISLRSGRHVLVTDNLSVGYPDKTLARNLTFQIERGDCIALIGPNGIGKTTLIRTLLGELTPKDGSFLFGHNVNVGYYDQEQTNLNLNKTVLDEIWDLVPLKTMTEVRTLLGTFLFIGEDVDKKIENLSGGEKSRLALLKFMILKANFLIMDEPTNHLDIPSKEVLEEALLEFDGTILLVSHDRYFINKLCNKILEFTPRGIYSYLGNYDDYLEKKKALEEDAILEEAQSKKTKGKPKDRMLKPKEDKALLNLQDEIIEMELRIEELEALLCNEKVYSNPVKAEEINREYVQLKESLEELYEKWDNQNLLLLDF
jgi:ATP-binding cassette subfamily F protein 3